jgi:hypothetical protein
MTLRGPAHPDTFRIKVGRNRERHYYDPLPADDLKPACIDVWPSVSRIKKAATQDWSNVSIRRCADWAASPEGQDFFARKPDGETVRTQFFGANRAGLSKALDRGNSIHEYMDAKATGGYIKVVPDAEPYIPAVNAFIDDCKPEWVLSEVVLINRTIGYGGTADAVTVALDLPNVGNVLIDWKTRTSADQHAAYDEDCWQVAAYAHAEYMIIDDGGQARRAPLPKLDGGLIVSLAPESYKLYPVDLDTSWDTFLALTSFWMSKTDRTYAGNPIHVPRATFEPLKPVDIESLRNRVLWIRDNSPEGIELLGQRWPAGVPTFKQGGPTDVWQATILAKVIDSVERDAAVSF